MDLAPAVLATLLASQDELFALRCAALINEPHDPDWHVHALSRWTADHTHGRSDALAFTTAQTRLGRPLLFPGLWTLAPAHDHPGDGTPLNAGHLRLGALDAPYLSLEARFLTVGGPLPFTSSGAPVPDNSTLLQTVLLPDTWRLDVLTASPLSGWGWLSGVHLLLHLKVLRHIPLDPNPTPLLAMTPMWPPRRVVLCAGSDGVQAHTSLGRSLEVRSAAPPGGLIRPAHGPPTTSLALFRQGQA